MHIYRVKAKNNKEMVLGLFQNAQGKLNSLCAIKFNIFIKSSKKMVIPFNFVVQFQII